ncbi:hypothetical protein [Lentzea flava]|uniref:DUF2637 domain-containing protein n=1 Tax=Lentzea flava TaxID=103732 RepID=A0ABQ2UZT4_9PSEU|nr:hypothetical protein [Lentzea flava]MCP2202724.1 hypothetical protein [Lentzea flava]GGU61640.1 hypothetical protein GCM10010178_62260 [Lentzea flava]
MTTNGTKLATLNTITEGSAEERREAARQVYRASLELGEPMSAAALAEMHDRSRAWARERIDEVRAAGGMPPLDEPAAATGETADHTVARHPVGQVPEQAVAAVVDEPVEEPPGAGGMPGTAEHSKVAGAWGMYFVALMATVISANTSYRFFGERLNISGMPFTVPSFGPLPGFTLDLERVALFGVMEVALIVLAYAMRANVIRIGRPGPAQWVAWGVCGFAAFAAWELSGPVEGTARVILGPVFGLVMLHLALGIEVKVRRGQSTGVWSQAGRELRERVLSRLGLGNDQRDALARTRDRAALRAARLAVEVSVMDKEAAGYGAKVDKLRKALHASNLAHDPQVRDRMLRELATLKHAETLAEVDQPSPW